MKKLIIKLTNFIIITKFISMLNLTLRNKSFSLNKLFKNKTLFKDDKNWIKSSKHFPASTREWKSSIYMYNKDNLNLIPYTDLYSLNIIKSYFILFNEKIEKKLRSKRLSIKFRRLSSNKIYISNGEFKHTNNKVIINLYLFNRQKNNYYLVLKKMKAKLILCLKRSHKIFTQRLKYLEKESLLALKKEKIFFIEKLKRNKRINNYINIYLEKFCAKFIINEQKKRLLYLYYKQINYINRSKYTYVYLQYLKEQLGKLYNKQVEFNLIDLKRFYLNSDILSESIIKKITKNRRNTLRYLNKLKNKVRVKRNFSFLHKYKIKNKLEYKNNLKSTNYLIKTITKNLKYKDITGFRLEAKGRLTKRYTASRSLYKIKYKGNLLNIDSSLKGLSSVLLKGNLKSNVQYTKLTSKSRIGSFGIKGWVSSN